MGLGRRIGILIGALFISVFLWSYVHLSQSYEADVDLPISVTAPKGLALNSPLSDRLHTRIKGAGWQILMMNFTKSSHYELDLSERELKDPTNRELIIRQDDLAHAVVLPSEVKMVKVEPDSLKLDFSTIVQKRIPVRVPINVSTAAGYAVVGSAVVTPATILVQGSGAVLDSLTSFPTKPLTRQDVREDISQEIELSDTLQNEVRLSQSQPVNVKLNVEALAERVFSGIPIELQAVPPDKQVLLIPGDLSITLRGGVDQLSNLSPKALKAHIMYDAIEFDTAQSITPVIDYPIGTTFLTSSPARIRFVVRRTPLQKNGN